LYIDNPCEQEKNDLFNLEAQARERFAAAYLRSFCGRQKKKEKKVMQADLRAKTKIGEGNGDNA